MWNDKQNLSYLKLGSPPLNTSSYPYHSTIRSDDSNLADYRKELR